MSKSEILDELVKLKPDERREILERICELQDVELSGVEKAFLDGRLAESRDAKSAWSSWDDARARVVSRLHKP